MNRLLVLVVVVMFVGSCSNSAKDTDISDAEPEPWMQREDPNGEWKSRYPEGFPLLSGGVPYKVNMSIFPEELQQLKPIIIAYDASQEELRDRLIDEIEESGWEYDLVVSQFPSLVYRFTATRSESRVMASVMDLGGLIVIQVIDATPK